MKKNYIILILLLISSILKAKENIHPTIEPASFGPQTAITVTYDATGTPLASLDAVYIWVWIPDASIDAKYNINPASSNASLSDNAKLVKSTEDGKTYFSITFVPQEFFAQPICLENQLGMLIKGNDWTNGQTEDYVASMTPLESCFVAKLTSPLTDPVFIDVGGMLSVKAESSETATFTLNVDGVDVDQQNDLTSYTYNYSIPQSSGTYPVTLNVQNAENDTTFSFHYLVNTPSDEMPRPAGVIPGINYDNSDATTATLCLLAPGKSSVYLLGEFNSFEIAPENQMYRDGNYFWLKVGGLTSGQEYAYQYLVDGVYVADPFSDKILDPDDRYIPDAIYPNLKNYPNAALHDEWYKNRLSVLQTGEPQYNWNVNDFQKPAKKDLVIYEIHMRDFFAEDDRNYANLADTLSYLKDLGINAIELMPIQEFAGNNSWGYNPTFMFAPDKAYGTETSLKDFIDAAHAQGIAVILDVVFNHQDIPNPYVAMWFDYSTFKVTPDNPMFNVTATHPYSVFYDMNHQSKYTQFYMDTTLNYWISQYKVDGYRFDLSKGFTQNFNTDVGAWGARDNSRIAIIERMADKVWSYDPNAYLILEHFADNAEETELANHGLMLWGNSHWDYKDLAIGTAKDISWTYFGKRGWDQPNLVSYMESHDEERIMYDLLNNGKVNGSYNIKDPETALNRTKEAAAFFFTVPGPKMIWEFEELGYDISINQCEDGTTNDGCRTSPKPVKWSYFSDADRRKLFKVFQALINLKTRYDVFESGTFSMTESSALTKEISLVNKDGVSDPENASEMSVYIIGNFDVQKVNATANFPFAGTWYDFFNGGQPISISDVNMEIPLSPGEFRVFVNYSIDFPEDGLTPKAKITTVEEEIEGKLFIYPNPTNGKITLELPETHGKYNIKITDITGREKLLVKETSNKISLDLSAMPSGLYLLNISGLTSNYSTRLIKN